MPDLVGYALQRGAGFGTPSLLIGAMLLACAPLVLSLRLLPAAAASPEIAS